MTAKEFLDRHQSIEGFVIAALTDEYIVDRWPDMRTATLDGKEEKLLELRVFNCDEEHKLFRTDIGREFTARMIRDGSTNGVILAINGEAREDGAAWESFDEDQFLDIDFAKKVRIRYYLSRYEETGQAKLVDWRVVDFLEEE